MKKLISFSCATCLIVWIFLLFLANQSMADTYCVADEANLLAALNDAEDNGSDDIIKIQQGTYYGNFVYASTESFGVTIEGGYNVGCSSRVVDPANTVLDGGQNGVVLALSAPNVVANFEVDGLTIQNGKISGNRGGGLFIRTDGNVTIMNNTISDNHTIQVGTLSAGGGGAYISGLIQRVTLTNNKIKHNSCAGFGGGAWIQGAETGTVNLKNNIISNNNAVSGSNSDGGGLAVRNAYTVTMDNNTLKNNNAYGTGDGAVIGIAEDGSIYLNNNTISYNDTVSSGVGLRLYGGKGSITLTDNKITNNSGAVSISDGMLIILTRNTVSNNKSQKGEAVKIIGGRDDATVILESNSINSNECGQGFGAIYIDGVKIIRMFNNILCDNQIDGIGGGILIDRVSQSVSLINNTICNNIAYNQGGGIYLTLYDDTATANIYNNIILNNIAGNGGGDLYIENDANNNYLPSTVNLYNNDFDQSANGIYIQRPFSIDPSNLNNEDPLFVDPNNGDFHLTINSPCIDAGASTIPIEGTPDGLDAIQGPPGFDIDGDSRPRDNGYDIGADEYPGPEYWTDERRRNAVPPDMVRIVVP